MRVEIERQKIEQESTDFEKCDQQFLKEIQNDFNSNKVESTNTVEVVEVTVEVIKQQLRDLGVRETYLDNLGSI